MFKTDLKTLEVLSFEFNERDIANLKSIIENLKSYDMLTISQEETQRVLDGLNEIGKLKLNGKIYGFHVSDSYADDQQGYGEGVELYRRQGDRLEEFMVPGSRDFTYSADDVAIRLEKSKISTIYTGEIPYGSNFLGLPYECDQSNPLIRDILEDYEIEELESNGIEVVKLDSLI